MRWEEDIWRLEVHLNFGWRTLKDKGYLAIDQRILKSKIQKYGLRMIVLWLRIGHSDGLL
jgi:hypothetical protein